MQYMLSVDGRVSHPDNAADIVVATSRSLQFSKCEKSLDRATREFSLRIKQAQEMRSRNFSDSLPELFAGFSQNGFDIYRCAYGLSAQDDMDEADRAIRFPSRVVAVSMTLTDDRPVPLGSVLHELYPRVGASVCIEKVEDMAVVQIQTAWIREQLQECMRILLTGGRYFTYKDISYDEQPFDGGSLVDYPMVSAKK